MCVTICMQNNDNMLINSIIIIVMHTDRIVKGNYLLSISS